MADGNKVIYEVRADDGNLEKDLNLSLIHIFAIWDTVYAKRVYEEGTPSKDKNPQASLRWVEKGVNTYKRELDTVFRMILTAITPAPIPHDVCVWPVRPARCPL